MRKVPIITYHSIDNTGSVISTAPAVFRDHMRALKDSGQRAISLSELSAMIRDGVSLPEKTVALTFDDGFQNFYTEAFPVLEQFKFKATVFLVTDFCGKHNDWEGDAETIPRSRLLDRMEILELSRNGIEFGSHTRTHPDLTRVSTADIESQVVQSKEIIEDLIGTEVTTFAYPYGKYNENVRNIVKQNYSAACSTKLKKAAPGSDIFSLERIDSYYLRNPKVSNMLFTKRFDGYLGVRRVLREMRSLVSS